MRIINVVELSNGIIGSIKSFGVFEEEYLTDVVNNAEKYFLDRVKENCAGYNEDDEEAHLDNGQFDNDKGYEVTIVWSEI